MSRMIQICDGKFGRAAILNLGHTLVEHAHSSYHLKFWLDGDFTELKVANQLVRFDDERAVAVNSFVPHASPHFETGQSSTFLLLYIDPIWFASRCAILDVSPCFPDSSLCYTRELHRLVRQLYDRMLDKTVEQPLDTELFVTDLVDESIRTGIVANHETQTAGKGMKREDLRILKALEFMNTHLDIRLGIEDVGSASGISRQHLFELFRKQMRMTPNVYWNTIRMESAIERLIASDIPVRDLSVALGFSEPGNFSRFFRNHAGAYPTQYRESAGNHRAHK